jgi:hypothetical protein
MFDNIMGNFVVGYQTGYSYMPKQFPLHALNIGCIALIILNFDYNYQPRVGSKFFLGIGVYEYIKFQYGYAIDSKNRIFRFRSDWNIFGISKKYYKNFEESTIGIFVEKRFGNNPTSGYSVGITIGLSFKDVGYWHSKKYLNLY